MYARHYHIFWECPRISTFRLNVVAEIRPILDFVIDFNVSVNYLENVSTTLQKYYSYILQILVAASKA